MTLASTAVIALARSEARTVAAFATSASRGSRRIRVPPPKVVLDWHRAMGYAPDVGKAMALAELGFVAEQRGDPVAARQYHAEALAITRELGDPRGIALGLEGRIRTWT